MVAHSMNYINTVVFACCLDDPKVIQSYTSMCKTKIAEKILMGNDHVLLLYILNINNPLQT